jgi:hypothetical protein
MSQSEAARGCREVADENKPELVVWHDVERKERIGAQEV